MLDSLVKLNGSSAGARPKVLIGVDRTRKHLLHGLGRLESGYEHWIVKFPNTVDEPDSGAVEFAYSIMAKEAGIHMSDTHLFPAEGKAGYFGTLRFDRQGIQRLHVHSACGLLHSDSRYPCLDYKDLMGLTEYLTKNAVHVEQLFRLAVFNVLSHNRDDHSRNF